MTETANRPRKSTISKLGKLLGVSSTTDVRNYSTDSVNKQEGSVASNLSSNNSSTTSLSNYAVSSPKLPNSPLHDNRSRSDETADDVAPLPSGTIDLVSVGSNPHSRSQPVSRNTSVKKSVLNNVNSYPSVNGSVSTPVSRATSLKGNPVSSLNLSNNHSGSQVNLTRESSVSQMSHMNGSPPPVTKPRFQILETGNHEHHLKSAKRQEKLGRMLKDWLGAKKLRDGAVSAVPSIISMVPKDKNAPPTLFSGLVNQVKEGGDDFIANMSPQPFSAVSVSSSDIDLRSFAEKYGHCQEVVGRGAFGVVRISHKKVNDNQEILYAVKEFKRKPEESEKKYSRRLTSEFCISSSLQHINIIHTLDLLQDAKGDYCEVMEFCSGGDLYSLIIASGKLEYAEADCFFKQLIRGVNYMHEMGVAHRDLKPENVLLTSNGNLKITDFGNGECFRMAWEKEVHLSVGICGSSPYIAPEEYTNEEFDPRAVDIWACGVIYMAMRTGRQLWKLANQSDEFYCTYLAKRKDAKGYDPIESLKRARCRNVIYSILDPVPNRRITGKQILNSEWGREIKVCEAAETGEICVI